MKLNFTKYQGAGNDFIIINRIQNDLLSKLTEDQIKVLCDRHFGIGADGLMIISATDQANFKMDYYNADGRLGSLCGNGSRCAINYYYEFSGYKTDELSFLAYDGIHYAKVIDKNIVKIQMSSVGDYLHTDDFYFIDTGSPHIVIFEDSILDIDVQSIGLKYRNRSPMKGAGSNVNIVERGRDLNKIRTFERGVEGETLACGTGVTAAALIKAVDGNYSDGNYEEHFQTLGGLIKVYFEKSKQVFKEIYLEGPAERVFEGTIEI
jgi:diaminopimelate epimerase